VDSAVVATINKGKQGDEDKENSLEPKSIMNAT
jgi:hypothetical protein